MAKFDLSAIGTSGLKHYSGQITEEFHPRLQGQLGAKIYREMADNDAVIGALLYTIETLIKQAEWRFEPADSTPEAEKIAEFFGTVVDDMSHTWEDFLTEVLSMLVFGWAYFEVVYKVRKGPSRVDKFCSKHEDGLIGWRKISLRAQETLDRWELGEDGGLRGMWQSAPPRYETVFIPIERSLLFRTKTSKGNPEGRSLLRNAYRSWYFAKRIQEIEAIGIERDLSGFPVMEVPVEILSRSASPDQKALRSLFETLVQQVKRDEREGMLIPPELDREGNPTGYKFKLLTSGGRRAIDTNATITRYETRILQSVLAEFIQLGMDQVGSFALASSKTATFAVALGSIMDSIASVINRFAVAKLMRLNGFDPCLQPNLVHGDLEAPPLEEVAAYVSQLVGVGALTVDDKVERKLREIGNLPQADDEDL